MQLQTNPRYLYSLALKCKKDEEKLFDRLIENKRAILPGVAFCQSRLIQDLSLNSVFRYQFVASAQFRQTTLLLVGRKVFVKMMRAVNEARIKSMSDEVARLIPAFAYLTKSCRYRIISKATVIAVPKGWR